MKGNNILAKLQTKFSVKDNKGQGLQGYLQYEYGIKLYHIDGIGFMVQRSDNRVLL